mgnify:CR=1 FL=1|tara:strand:+ start:190 stop:708 length:519 start_codon:yes stop_codon:yes gene_type:complete
MSYDFLKSETSPKLLVEAVKLLGTKEVVGKVHNPVILGWAKEVGLSKVYTADEIPWCGLAVAYAAHKAGVTVVEKPLWALSWANYGTKVSEPMLGDILTFKRDGGGHVGIYVGEDKDCYHVLGGNQGNAMSVSRIVKSRLYQARRTKWKVAQPANVRKVILDAKGAISKNEA